MGISGVLHNPPQTITATSHGIQIVAKGVVVGEIIKWTPATQTRGGTWVYELNYETSGVPVDFVPGNTTGYTINLTRYDLWSSKYEEVFGDASIEQALGQQYAPFDVRQYLKRPDGTKELWVYRSCWMTSVGRDYGVDGDRIIKVQAVLSYVKKERIL